MALRLAAMAPVVWGTFAFGAVYPWAYYPLAVACALVGALLLVVEREGRPPLGVLTATLTATALAIVLQLVPLSRETLARVSPQVESFFSQHEQAYGVLRSTPAGDPQVEAASSPGRRPISIAPDKTRTGLLLFGGLALFALGVTRFLSATGAGGVVGFLIGTGVVLALVGIGQYTLTLHELRPMIYGFWKPMFMARPFGPFVNPNHFAGWMLMVLPLALARFYEALERTLQEAKRLAGNRIAIASSPGFGALASAAVAALVMGLSLLMTRSRSGLAAFGVASVLAAWMVLRRQRSWSARAAVAAAFVLLLGGAAVWAGVDTLSSKFEQSGGSENLVSIGGRIPVWKDTLQVFRAYPAAGTGFNTFGTAMLVYQTGERGLHYQEAHNDYLQILAEGGLLVGLPVIATLGVFAWTVRKRFREAPKEGTTYWLRVGAVIGIVTIATQAIVEFSLQMPGNAALFAVMAAIALHQSPRLRTGSTGPRVWQEPRRDPVRATPH